MARIKLDIDSEANEASYQAPKQMLLPRKIGLLSSIPLTTALIEAFEFGAGVQINERRLAKGYKKNELNNGKNELQNDGCAVIATAGGSVVFKAIVQETNNRPFVSLLGSLPNFSDNIGNCYGGVSLQSYESNKDRTDLLVNKKAIPLSNIGLYCNPNSEMHNSEKTHWEALYPAGSPSTLVKFSGAGADGANDATKFAADLGDTSIVPANIRALVISADPFFQANKEELIAAANTWVSNDPNRYICYPLQIYGNTGGTNKPIAGKAGLYGPDLEAAFRLLGFVAKQVRELDQPVGFCVAANQFYEVT